MAESQLPTTMVLIPFLLSPAIEIMQLVTLVQSDLE